MLLLSNLKTVDIVFIVIASSIGLILLILLFYYLFGNVYQGMRTRKKKYLYNFSNMIKQIDDVCNAVSYFIKANKSNYLINEDLNNLLTQLKNVNKEKYTKELYDLISTFEKILKITNIDETTNTYSEDTLDFKNYTTIKAFIYSNKVYLDSVKDYNNFLNLPINKMLRKYYKFSLADDFENSKPNEQNTKK